MKFYVNTLSGLKFRPSPHLTYKNIINTYKIEYRSEKEDIFFKKDMGIRSGPYFLDKTLSSSWIFDSLTLYYQKNRIMGI